MKNSRFTDEQVILILKEAELGAKPISQVCREHNVSEATFYSWRKKYGGMEVSQAKRLKALEQENNELKKMLANVMLEKNAIEAVLKKW